MRYTLIIAHLDIDLFDDEGFSLADINETLVGSEHLTAEISEDVYFIDDELEVARSLQRAVKKEKKGGVMEVTLSLDEEVDLNKTWVCHVTCILCLQHPVPVGFLYCTCISLRLKPGARVRCCMVALLHVYMYVFYDGVH